MDVFEPIRIKKSPKKWKNGQTQGLKCSGV